MLACRAISVVLFSRGILVVTLSLFAAIQNPVQKLLDGIHSEQAELFENIAYGFLALFCRAIGLPSFRLQGVGISVQIDAFCNISVIKSALGLTSGLENAQCMSFRGFRALGMRSSQVSFLYTGARSNVQ